VTAPFVSGLRARRDAVHVGRKDGRALTLRVEVPELWDVVRVVAAPDATVEEVKGASLRALNARANPAAYVIKLRGFEALRIEKQRNCLDAARELSPLTIQ